MVERNRRRLRQRLYRASVTADGPALRCDYALQVAEEARSRGGLLRRRRKPAEARENRLRSVIEVASECREPRRRPRKAGGSDLTVCPMPRRSHLRSIPMS
jgi:hypothetical protein